MRIQRDSSLSFDGSSCFSFRRASLSLSLSLSLMRLASAETRTTINAVTVERGSGGGGGGIFRRAVTRTDAFRPLGATERGGLPRKPAGRSRSRVPKSIWLALAAEWSPPSPSPSPSKPVLQSHHRRVSAFGRSATALLRWKLSLSSRR